MSTALATRSRQTRALARAEGWSFTPEETQLIKSTCAPADVTDAEFRVFLYVSAQRRLNPLLKQIYAVRRKGKIVHQTGIDGFRATAARTGLHAGTDDAVCAGTAGAKGHVATVTVWKIVNGVRCPFTASARWEEYLPEPPNDFMWKRMPSSQLGKCAEALALRKAFPEDLGGLYTSDEMEQAGPAQSAVTGHVIDMPTQPVPAPAAAAPATEKKARKRAEPEPVQRQAPRVEPPAAEQLPKISRDQQVLLFTLSKERGLSERELRHLVTVLVHVESTKDIPRAIFDGLLAAVESDDVHAALRDHIETPDDARLRALTSAVQTAVKARKK